MERKLFYWIFVFGCLHNSSANGKIVSLLTSYLSPRTDRNVERKLWEKSNKSVANLRLANSISYETTNRGNESDDVCMVKLSKIKYLRTHKTLMSQSFSIHSSTFRRLSGVGSRGQQPEQGSQMVCNEQRADPGLTKPDPLGALAAPGILSIEVMNGTGDKGQPWWSPETLITNRSDLLPAIQIRL